MKPKTRLFWMFAPLLLLFVGLFIAINDLKHPTRFQDTCQVLGTGPAMTKLNTGRNRLYAQSDSPMYEIGFQCHQLGTVVLNDLEPFKRSLTVGDKATLLHKTFRFLPEIWRVQVQTHLTLDEQEALQKF